MKIKPIKLRYMFDTNVFNALLEGTAAYSPGQFKDIAVTDAQRTEVMNTKNFERKRALLKELDKVKPIDVPMLTTAWGYFKWGAMPWGLTGSSFESFKAAMRNHLDGKCKKCRKSRGHIGDALIGEVCLTQKFTLVSNDPCFRDVLISFGGSAISLSEFIDSQSQSK